MHSTGKVSKHTASRDVNRVAPGLSFTTYTPLRLIPEKSSGSAELCPVEEQYVGLTVKACWLYVSCMRELFGSRVRAGRLEGEPVMRAERVLCRLRFGCLTWSACMTDGSVRAFGLLEGTRWAGPIKL